MAKSRPAKGSLRLEHLPVELLLEILSYTTTSAAVYRSLLLVSKPLNSLVKLNCLREVPVVLEGSAKLRSFDRFLSSTSKAHTYVRYLWIQGDGLKSWGLVDSIVTACSGVVSLSCTSRTLASLCASPAFSHRDCHELALIEPAHEWRSIIETTHGSQFCMKITHLRLQEGINPDFPKQYFTSLSHLAFSYGPFEDYLKRYSERLSGFCSLQLIVATTVAWRDGTPDPSTTQLMERDKRLAILQCRENWTELDAWKDRVRGGRSLWEQARVARQSMQVFRDAFKVLQIR
ncbi:hypothetical protein C0991_012510 [Blastosporella zonata]|nr:hypothetical protein C0991_012510 [Blastosporella zonata]